MSAPPARATGRSVLLNASASFLLAAIVAGILHEGAHAVAGLALGLTPTVTPFSVGYRPEPSTAQAIVTALAGPVFSLVLGVTLLAVARRWGRGFVRLFWMWLAFLSAMNFVGYLLIAPFARAGDTARALTLLGAPGLVFGLAAVLGAALQLGLAYLFAREVKRYTHGLPDERALALRAWALGTAANVVLVVVELLLVRPEARAVVAVACYAVAVGIFAPMQFIFSGRVPRRPVEDGVLDRLSPAGLAMTGGVAALMVLLAGLGGISLG